ncbi:MAG TPA: NUDIX domain-containing protein [Gammaproteobacteria bacterium]|nr:NUDIX domain-containing protein [Gammaproteobacteria bacterium]
MKATTPRKSGDKQAREPLDFERPLSTVDVVIFAVRGSALQVLLVRRPSDVSDPYPGLWALPGGFVDIARDRDLEACALRKLREKTGVDAPYLEQLGSWGDSARDPRGWSATHVYFSLVAPDAVGLTAGGNATDTRWFTIEGDLVEETLAFDHASLLKAAVSRLRSKVEYTSLPAFLLPQEFTLTELQRTYEAILDRTLEKKAFRTRLLTADVLYPVPRRKGGANRPAQLYRLRRRRQPHLFARPFGSAPGVS